MDFPPSYATDPTRKVPNEARNVVLGSFKGWQQELNNQTERIKNDSQVESTKAKGTLDSSSAAIDLATAIVKIMVTNTQTIAASLKT